MTPRPELWRWLTCAVACATIGGGLASLFVGGPSWPLSVGAIACTLLGEVYRWHVRLKWDREFYQRRPELYRGWPPL